MAFTFFKTKKPIETRRQQRDALAARLSSAQADVATAREACTGAAVEGATDAELAKVEFAKRQAEDRVQSLTSALHAFDDEIAAQASAEAAAADRKVREATARELCGRADKIEKGLTPLLTAVRTSAADIETSRQIVGEIGIFELFARLVAELPPAFALIAGELRTRAAMTLTERAPATLPQPEVITPPTPPIPRTRIFAMQNLKFRDPETNQVRLVERFDIVELPNNLVDLAFSKNLATDPASDRARELIKLRRGAPPPVERCVDLDAGGELPAPPSNVPWDAFARIDRGPPVTAFIPAPPNVEPVAARHAPLADNEPDHEP